MDLLLNIGTLIFIAIVIAGVLVMAINLEKKSAAGYVKVADENGWQYEGKPLRHNHTVRKSLLSKARIKRTISDRIAGEYEGLHIEIFINHRKSGDQISQETVFCIEDEQHVQCEFELTAMNFAHKIIGVFGGKGVRFDDHPNFASLYKLKASDEDAVRDVFQPEALKYFEKHPGYNIVSAENKLLCYRLGKVVKSEEIIEELRSVISIYRILYTDSMQKQFINAL